MEFSFTPQQTAFREEIRDFLRREMTPEVMARAKRGYVGPYYSDEIKKKFVERGWSVVHWPKELGGQGWSPIEQTIFFEECGYSGITPGGLQNVAETIRIYGSEQQKEYFLPRFARGEVGFTLGLSEANAGVDAANVQMRADLQGDHYVINGSKLWGGSGDEGYAKDNWHWLICRTDQQAERHRGLSIVLVPLESPGITIRPIHVLGSMELLEDHPVNTVCAIYYDDVVVPKENLLGEENRGWYQLMTGLDTLRTNIAAGYLGQARRTLDDITAYVRERKDSPRWIAGSQWVRFQLAQHAAETQVLWNLSYQIAYEAQKGRDAAAESPIAPSHLASMAKIWSADLLQRLSATAMQVLGIHGVLARKEAERWLPFADEVQRLARWSRQLSIGGGSSEVLRTQIAERYLGMARS
ncbi:MAG: acyl-CoA dehydrogenase family protein [Dehalococcoidia bacterium]